MSDKLLVCPFCGDEAETKMYLWGEHAETHAPIWCYYAFCRACDAMTDNVFKTEEEAIAAWNRRSDAVPVVRGECKHFERPGQDGKRGKGMKCKKCHSENLVMRPNAKNPSATDLICGDCGTWQKFIGKEEIRIFEIKAALKLRPTNADRIRSMSDAELAKIIYSFEDLKAPDYCQRKKECDDMLDSDMDIPAEKCIGCLLDWLRKEVADER